jgi:hypothetical protein
MRVNTSTAVPAESREMAEVLVAPYLISPNAYGVYTFSAPLVPLDGPADVEPTYYGCVAAVLDGGALQLAIPQLISAIPGAIFKVSDNPVDFDYQMDWLDFLATHNLKPQVLPMPTND